ncbi:helix-turn-helix transcriptional regulator [Gluconobacter albidus]|uniref:helix-turn-helix transcriptional regulator n=1 Tax=Gluconobacter albidus TaxID=318683 RepID=UPI001E4C4FFB|nr:helix-turn-helix domain-containing protein [Gluconobacter albidus]
MSARRLVLSEIETAEELSLSVRTLQAMRLEGTGPAFIKLTQRRIGYALSELERWISERSVRSTAEATVRAQREAASC